jgi:hypothetical protein
MRRSRDFLPDRPNKNIFRARQSHPETGIAQYTCEHCIGVRQMIEAVTVIMALFCVGIFVAHAIAAYHAR